MNLPKIVPHDEWLVARQRLLAKEKDSNSTERATASNGPIGNHRPRDPRTRR
jgi:predicted dithiol-disulfide oxidoreductase (DUF899 family)